MWFGQEAHSKLSRQKIHRKPRRRQTSNAPAEAPYYTYSQRRQAHVSYRLSSATSQTPIPRLSYNVTPESLGIPAPYPPDRPSATKPQPSIGFDRIPPFSDCGTSPLLVSCGHLVQCFLSPLQNQPTTATGTIKFVLHIGARMSCSLPHANSIPLSVSGLWLTGRTSP